MHMQIHTLLYTQTNANTPVKTYDPWTHFLKFLIDQLPSRRPPVTRTEQPTESLLTYYMSQLSTRRPTFFPINDAHAVNRYLELFYIVLITDC